MINNVIVNIWIFICYTYNLLKSIKIEMVNIKEWNDSLEEHFENVNFMYILC